MAAPDPKNAGRRSDFIEIVSVMYFSLCLLAWVKCLPIVCVNVEKALHPLQQDDTGGIVLIIIIPVAGVVGLVTTVIAVILSIMAKRLPRWFRIAMVALPAAMLAFTLFMIIAFARTPPPP
jgi:uncharacterized BrkB/YihY/UPF0761 family membrane protein